MTFIKDFINVLSAGSISFTLLTSIFALIVYFNLLGGRIKSAGGLAFVGLGIFMLLLGIFVPPLLYLGVAYLLILFVLARLGGRLWDTKVGLRLFVFDGCLRVFPRSIGKAIAKHWQTALRLCATRLILQNVPVFGQHPVGDTHDVSGDPVSRASKARESSVDDDKVAFGHDHARLVFEGRRSGLDKVEQTFAARLDMSAVLDVVRRPEAFGGRVVSLVEQGVECLKDERLVLRFR